MWLVWLCGWCEWRVMFRVIVDVGVIKKDVVIMKGVGYLTDVGFYEDGGCLKGGGGV